MEVSMKFSSSPRGTVILAYGSNNQSPHWRPPHDFIYIYIYIEEREREREREKGSLASEDAGLLSTGRKTGDEWESKGG